MIRIGRFPVQTPLGAWPGLETQPRYEARGDLQLKILKRSDQHWVSEAVSLRMAQSWLWDSQVVKKIVCAQLIEVIFS